MAEVNDSAFEADATGGKTIAELQAENERLRAQQATTTPPEDEPEIYDKSGRQVGEETKNTPDVSTAQTVTIAGEEFRFFPPKPTALIAFGMGASAKRNGQMQMAAMYRFLSFSLLEEDYDRLMNRMTDPADEFNETDMGDMIGAIADKVRESNEAKAPKNGPLNGR